MFRMNNCVTFDIVFLVDPRIPHMVVGCLDCIRCFKPILTRLRSYESGKDGYAMERSLFSNATAHKEVFQLLDLVYTDSSQLL